MIQASRIAGTREIVLSTGTLQLDVRGGTLPLDGLCTFAARRNPRRGFLFVSTVLGRYLPVRSASLMAAQRRLAQILPHELPGPIVMVALAEAAIGLGQGVHQQYVESTGRADVLFLHSTRYHLSHPLLATFDEPHSHAPAHHLHRPIDPTDGALLDQARTVVLIDDEMTTGRTLGHLATALRAALPSVEQVIPLVLTDWSGQDRTPTGTPPLSLLWGHYTFEPRVGVAYDMPNVVGDRADRTALLTRNEGRLGIRIPVPLPPVPSNIDLSGRVLVLGTGEYQGGPARLAEALTRAGVDAWFQATTRAPVKPGQVIRSFVQGYDNYGEGMPNFLYNFDPQDWNTVLLCQETPSAMACPQMLAATGARLIEL